MVAHPRSPDIRRSTTYVCGTMQAESQTLSCPVLPSEARLTHLWSNTGRCRRWLNDALKVDDRKRTTTTRGFQFRLARCGDFRESVELLSNCRLVGVGFANSNLGIVYRRAREAWSARIARNTTIKDLPLYLRACAQRGEKPGVGIKQSYVVTGKLFCSIESSLRPIFRNYSRRVAPRL
jgi:hypothetical protein